MQKFFFLLTFLASFSALAVTQTTKQARLQYALGKAGLPASQSTILMAGIVNVLYYDTYVELAAAAPTEGLIGYAIDSNAFYLRSGASWVPLNSTTSFTGANGGTVDNATNNIWKLGENSEDLTLTFGSNLVTFASTTSATFAFTPAVAITGDLSLGGGAGALTFTAASSSVVVPNNSATALTLGSSGLAALLTLDTRTGVEQLMVAGTTTQIAFNVAVGTSSFAEKLTVAAGAGALTLTNTAASFLLADDDVSALDIGSAGRTSLLRFVTSNDAEKVQINGYAGAVALDVASGTASFTEGANLPLPAMTFDKVRLCGNGANGNTENFFKPILESDYGTDMSFGAAACDSNDSTTKTTADLVWGPMAYKAMGMTCVLTGDAGSNDLVTFQLYDDTSAVTDMTCSVTLAGASNKQCTVRDVAPTTIASGSQITVGVVGVDDNEAAQPAECYLFVTY